jgi:tryptophan halogenase
MKKYSIIGGGTAGWLTALYAKKKFPDSEVCVIASSELGILGAGEGTTPTFISFLEFIDIPIDDIIKHAKGTIKNAIKFTNWNNDSKHYYHCFLDRHGKYELDDRNKNFDFKPYYLDKITKGEGYNDIQLSSIICESNKVKYDKNTLENYGQYALHFDANLLAKYLESVGLERGIKLIDDEVIGINADTDAYITSFNLKSNGIVHTDFVFDCTGFKRLIIGNFYKSKWNTYKEHLPVNRAMPFFIPNDNKDLEPYTESIAMKYGWMWKIPVQGRYGCGYVFDSSFVSDEQIKQELEEYLGHEINSPRMFSFDPGCYDEVLIKNCMAVGLSAGFVEPLEATSILVSTIMLKQFGNMIESIHARDKKEIDILNTYSRRVNTDVLTFVHFHYLTKRDDSEFWKTFRTKNKSVPFINALDDVSKNNIPAGSLLDYLHLVETRRITSLDIIYTCLFSESSWLQVGSGIRYFNSDIAKTILNNSYPEFESTKYDMKREVFEPISSLLFDHSEYLTYIKNNE